MWAIYGPRRPTNCVLSIGTGIPTNQSLDGIVNLAKNMSGVATNTELTHILFRTLINAYAPNPCQDKYWRLNVGIVEPEHDETQKNWRGKETTTHHLDNYKDLGEMDDLKTLPTLIALTKTYIEEQKIAIGQCAEKLRDNL
jgi:hypothetical protein